MRPYLDGNNGAVTPGKSKGNPSLSLFRQRRLIRMNTIMRIAGKPLIVLMALAAASVSHAGTVTYIYTDPQGTALAETDASGNVTATFDYKPFGSQALGSPPNGPGFTGHVNDADTNLVYMQARYYDSAVGRFLSVDPVKVNGKTAVNFNRYWYANDNPIRFIDPDGRYSCSDNPGLCAKIAQYVEALQRSRDALSSSRRSGSELRLVEKALREIGEEGKGGPHYVEGVLEGRAAAHTDQKGTTTVDTGKLDVLGDKANEAGAQAIAHEARHDIDVREGGIKTTENQVRETETNAYSTSRAVDQGFGRKWTQQQFHDAVDASVELWKNQSSPEQHDEH